MGLEEWVVVACSFDGVVRHFLVHPFMHSRERAHRRPGARCLLPPPFGTRRPYRTGVGLVMSNAPFFKSFSKSGSNPVSPF